MIPAHFGVTGYILVAYQGLSPLATVGRPVGAAKPYFGYPSGCLRCQFQAVSTIGRSSVYFGSHPSSLRTLSDAATSAGGSPGRRGPSLTAIGLPVTSSHVRITSRTLYPLPIPT